MDRGDSSDRQLRCTTFVIQNGSLGTPFIVMQRYPVRRMTSLTAPKGEIYFVLRRFSMFSMSLVAETLNRYEIGGST